MLTAVPLFHAYALDLVINRSFTAVQSMVLHSRFDAASIFRDFEKYNVTLFNDYGCSKLAQGNIVACSS